MSRTAGWVTLFLIGTDLFVVSPLLPSIAHNLEVSLASAGLMVTVFALAYVVGGPRLGALADRLGRAPVLAVSLFVFAVANLLTGIAPDLAVLLVARGLAGLAASGVTPSVYAMVGASAPEGRRATWLAVVTSGLLLALSTGAPIGSLLASVVGWRGVFLILAGAALAILVVNVGALEQRAVAVGPARADSRQGGLRAASVATRIRAVSVTGLWAMAVYGVYTYLGAGLRVSAGFGTALVAAGVAIYGAGALAGNLIGGPLADRRGGRLVTTASLTALAAVQALLGAMVAVHPALLVGLGLFALAAYPYFSAHQNRLVTAFPGQSGSLLAWNNTAMYVGILIGSVAGGRILANGSLSLLFEAAAVVAAVGALATRWAIVS